MNGFFDGDFRRKPNVSIGGANRKLNKEELLAKAQKERDEREVGKKYIMMSFQDSVCEMTPFSFHFPGRAAEKRKCPEDSMLL